jgi:exodeoxyribonuclease VII small subunit
MSEQSLQFEQSLRRLDEIVKRMEEGNVPLAEALKLFEEGTSLAATCGRLLDEAELKVVELVKGKDGHPVEKETEYGK